MGLDRCFAMLPAFRRLHPARINARTIAAIAALMVSHSGASLEAQDPPPAEAPASASPISEQSRAGVVTEKQLQFSFDGAHWREVLKWLAESADLALHVGELPRGSFTYSDPQTYTPQEAIDRVNLFLLPEGYTLIRSGRLLSVIDLSDPRSSQQLNALARMVTIDQLDELEDHTVAKCFFALGELKPEEAVEELSALELLRPPAVFNRTNQLLIVDTVARLKNVRSILTAFQPRTLGNGTVVKSFVLEHVDAEDFLLVARPHLGLATGETIGIDVSISSDPQGKKIFVTGVEDKVKVVEGLIESVDRAEATSEEESELRMHLVQGGNVQLANSVLQTLLAGQTTVRLSTDEAAGGIVALAPPAIQKQIEETIAQLQTSDAQFEVIPLRNVDPYFAISLLQGMLDLPDPLDTDPKRKSSDDDPTDVPRIDADVANMRLFVRAKPAQLEQIRKIVTELDSRSVGGELPQQAGIRIYPLTGKQAQRILMTAAGFWQEPNAIILFQTPVDADESVTERVVADEGDVPTVTASQPGAVRTSTRQVLTPEADPTVAAIRCQLLPRGILLQCDDSAALDRLEELLRTIAGPGTNTLVDPVVFYLKYTRPDDAVRMLADLLDGDEALTETQANSLVNSYVSGSSVYLGSLVDSREGMTTMTSGTVTVVADSRLNRVIVQGTAGDVDRIEGYLKIIDKDRSLTSIETYGTSHVIELKNVKASEVADVIREAYGERVAGNAANGQANAQRPDQKGQPPAPAPKSSNDPDPRKQGDRNAATKPTRTLEPRMTIAVHEASNSLVVTAPESLFREVEKLAQLIDVRSKRNVVVVPTENGATQLMLLKAFAEQAADTSSRSAVSTSRTSSIKGRSDR